MHPEVDFRELDCDEGPVLEDKNSGGPEIGADFVATQKTWLYRLVGKYQDMFNEKPGTARGVEHHLVTPLGCIARDQKRRHPRHLFEPVKRQLEQMRKWGIIEESRSLWSSPVVIVPEPVGTISIVHGL